MFRHPLEALRHHVSGAIERGEAREIIGVPVGQTKRDIYPAYTAAEDAWNSEGARLFGKRWGDVRYTPRGNGEPGTELRRLYNAYLAQREAWHAAPVSLSAEDA